jgi:hypothetical protein
VEYGDLLSVLLTPSVPLVGSIDSNDHR